MSINWPLCDLIHWDLFGLVPSKYEGNSTRTSFFLFTDKKRTAKILISIQYQQSSHHRHAKVDYFCWTDSWTGDDAKLDRFLKRLEGAASHFGSPPQIRMARPGVFSVHLFLDLGEEMEPNSKSTLSLKSERWSQPELHFTASAHRATRELPGISPPVMVAVRNNVFVRVIWKSHVCNEDKIQYSTIR